MAHIYKLTIVKKHDEGVKSKKEEYYTVIEGTYQKCLNHFKKLQPSEVCYACIERKEDDLPINRLKDENHNNSFLYGSLNVKSDFSLSPLRLFNQTKDKQTPQSKSSITALSNLHKYLVNNQCNITVKCYDKGNDLRGYKDSALCAHGFSKLLPEHSSDEIVDAVLMSLPEDFNYNITRLTIQLGYYYYPRRIAAKWGSIPKYLYYWLEELEEGYHLLVHRW